MYSNCYQDYSKGNVVIHTALGGQIAADASLIPGFGLAVLMSDMNLAIQGKGKCRGGFGSRTYGARDEPCTEHQQRGIVAPHDGSSKTVDVSMQTRMSGKHIGKG